MVGVMVAPSPMPRTNSEPPSSQYELSAVTWV
jgi:hypothetical protein